MTERNNRQEERKKSFDDVFRDQPFVYFDQIRGQVYNKSRTSRATNPQDGAVWQLTESRVATLLPYGGIEEIVIGILEKNDFPRVILHASIGNSQYFSHPDDGEMTGDDRETEAALALTLLGNYGEAVLAIPVVRPPIKIPGDISHMAPV